MKIDIILTNSDVIRAIFYSNCRSKAIWVICIICAIFTNAVSVVGLWSMGWPLSASLGVLFSFFAWVFGLYAIGLVITIATSVLNPKWRRGRVGSHTIEINEKGIVESTEYNHSAIYWPSISRTYHGKAGLYFLHSGSDAFIIPRRCFATEERWQAFIALFYRYYQGQ